MLESLIELLEKYPPSTNYWLILSRECCIIKTGGNLFGRTVTTEQLNKILPTYHLEEAAATVDSRWFLFTKGAYI